LKFRTIDEIETYKKEVMIWQIIGVVVIFGLGALWHFMYEWIQWKPIGWFLPVNESVWEHVKLMFWPALLYYVVEGIFLYKKTNNFIFAKSIAFYFTPLMSMGIFYAVYFATGFENFIFDTVVLFILTGIQQFISYKLLTREPIAGEKHIILIMIAIILIVTLAILLIAFTYYPPKIILFEHEFASSTGEYGILNNYGVH
jgi:hypothetical protein